MFAVKTRTLKFKPGNLLYRRLIVILLAVAVTVPLLMKSRESSIKAASTAFPFLDDRIYVCVGGDVAHPGVYSVSVNKMTIDAIQLAEPFGTPKAYFPPGVERLQLRNGTDIKITISYGNIAKISVGSIPTAHRIILGIPLDINTMSAEDLDRIPGIGPVLAKRIIGFRQFNGGSMTAQELLAIEGIGEKKYKYLKKFITN